VPPIEPSHLTELMSLLAHDLRNPLSAILTNVNFIRSTVRGRAPDLEEALSDTAISCAMLGHVIGTLDVLSRSFSTGSLAARPTGARQTADDTALRFAAEAALVGVRIELPDGPHAPILLVEPTYFARALDSLVANALQYSPANGRVRIEFIQMGDRGSVIVTDEGPPIPSDLRVLTTSAEWQNEAKQRHEARYGRGLGLYCAAEAARIAGAQIDIGEREGRSAFELSAPLSMTASVL
jgi:signal transduction histidine kinase